MPTQLKFFLCGLICFMTFGCTTITPYHELPEVKASIQARKEYDTGLAVIKQDLRERKIDMIGFHTNWIELLKKVPSSWYLKEIFLDAQYELLHIAKLIKNKQAEPSAYKKAQDKYNARINQATNEYERNEARNSQILSNAVQNSMNNIQAQQRQLQESQRQIYQQEEPQGYRIPQSIHCTSTRLDNQLTTTNCY